MKISVLTGGFQIARLQEQLRRLEREIHETLERTDARRVRPRGRAAPAQAAETLELPVREAFDE